MNWLLGKDIFRRTWWVWPIVLLGSQLVAVFSGDILAQVLLLIMLLYAQVAVVGIGAGFPGRSLQTLPLAQKTTGRTIWSFYAMLLPVAAFGSQMGLYAVRWFSPRLDCLPPQVFLANVLLIIGALCAIQLTGAAQIRYAEWATRRSLLADLAFTVFSMVPVWFAVIFCIRLDMQDLSQLDDPFIGSTMRLLGPRARVFDLPNSIALLAAAILAACAWRSSHRIVDIFAFSAKNKPEGFLYCPPVRTLGFASKAASRAMLWTRSILWGMCGAGVIPLMFGTITLAVFLDPEISRTPDLWFWPAVLSMISLVFFCGNTLLWLLSIRTLRILPMRRTRLALHLLLCPVLTLVTLMIFTCTLPLFRAAFPSDLGASLVAELMACCLFLAGFSCLVLPRIGLFVGLAYWCILFLAVEVLALTGLGDASLPWLLAALPIALALGSAGIYHFLGEAHPSLTRFQEFLLGVRR